MRIQRFLEHHGVASNPFAEEDAQTDPVFKEHCIASAYHPAWDKVYGDPSEPATAVVFGEKGAGKTALRLQIVRHLAEYNRTHAGGRMFIIEYDDFNPFLDRFRDKVGMGRRTTDRVLAEWKLWDHMDAILSLGVTHLVDRLLGRAPSVRSSVEVEPLDAGKLARDQGRDLLLLAAIYDQSSAESLRKRWHRLRRKARFLTIRGKWPLALGVVVTIAVAAVIIGAKKWDWLAHPWPYLFVLAGWGPWLARSARLWWRARGIVRQVKVINHDTLPLAQVLGNFTSDELSNQPLPDHERTDDRFEMLLKFQGLLKTLGYSGIVVLVDRVDEPHLVNGSPDRMRALLWPMLDNKFLKHPGIGFKLMLPIELSYFIEREDRDFYQRARLDKQNVVPSLQWTGEALYDVADARLKACAAEGRTPQLRQLFDPAISDRRLIDSFRSLRVPRHLFKFLYRVFVAHSNAHTDDNPVWQITSDSFEPVLALYQRDQDAFERGLGAG